MYLTLWNLVDCKQKVLDKYQWRAFTENVPEEMVLKALPPPRIIIIEPFVLSFDMDHVEQFKQRNNHSGLRKVLWVPGVDGFHQKTLDMWAKLSGKFPIINASLFDYASREDHDKYRSPHAVGCYLAHWHLLRTLNHREPELQPNLYFIFEDDASCIPDLVRHTLDAVSQLPPDWDMFFIGGKPYTSFPKGENFNSSTLRHYICRGIHGKGDGPLASDGSRQLSTDQPYWQIEYITDTHAYVVNPQRVSQILRILKPQEDVPIDIRLAEAMQSGELNVYMPTQFWCSADVPRMNHPETWWGYFDIPGAGNIFQDKLQLDNCSY